MLDQRQLADPRIGLAQTSMGRLTLNVLLSFAQFEREVTSELRSSISCDGLRCSRTDLMTSAHGAALILSSAKRPEGRRWIPPSGDRFPVFAQAG